MSDTRVAPLRTAKMLIDGKFVRSESGRTFPALAFDGQFVANVPDASRKDARDAVVAARKALAGWSAASAYNRGQVAYRIAEVLEGRSAQMACEVAAAEGLSAQEALTKVHAGIDRVVWYAGWADKVSQVLSQVNPVGGTVSSVSSPVPSGVVALVAPHGDSLLGLVSTLMPYLVTGCTLVVVTDRSMPLPSVTLGEVLATSDVPAGVVNLLPARHDEVLSHLAAHGDVDVLDLAGVVDPALARSLEQVAANTLKRVHGPSSADWSKTPSLARLRRGVEVRTVWSTSGR